MMWIAIADSMPPPFVPVVVLNEERYENADDGCGERNVQAAAYWNPNMGGYWSIRGERAIRRDAFTHWLMLPQFVRFAEVFCSQCGRDFGPGNHGFSHCENHADIAGGLDGERARMRGAK